GGALAPGHVARRRRLRLPAALRCSTRARADRRRAYYQPLSGADALSRPLASSAVRGDRREFGAQTRLRGGADDRGPTQQPEGRVQAGTLRQSLRLLRNL